MAKLTDYKLDEAAFRQKDVASLPDKPSGTMTAEALKAAFDKSSKAVLMPALNGVIDTLVSTEGAASIGTADGETLEAKAQKADGAAAAAATAAGEATAAKTAAEAATTAATAASTAASQAAETAAAAAEAASGATALLKGNKPVIDLVAAGNGTAYTAQSERVTALEAGMLFVTRFSAANTGAVTLDINSLGAKPVKQIGTSGAKGDCIAGDFGMGQRYWLQYDGAEFYPIGSSARAAKSGIWVGETEPPADAGYALWVDPSDMAPGELTGFGALNTGDIPKFGGDYLVPAVPGEDYLKPGVEVLDWKVPTMEGDCSLDPSGGEKQLRYAKDKQGFVYLNGLFKKATLPWKGEGAAKSAITTLPMGYRPQRDLVVPVTSTESTVVGVAHILKTGAVTYAMMSYAGTTVPSYWCIDAVFRAAN